MHHFCGSSWRVQPLTPRLPGRTKVELRERSWRWLPRIAYCGWAQSGLIAVVEGVGHVSDLWRLCLSLFFSVPVSRFRIMTTEIVIEVKNKSPGNYAVCLLSEFSFKRHLRSSALQRNWSPEKFQDFPEHTLSENQAGNSSPFHLSALCTAQWGLPVLPHNNHLALENHLISLDSHNGRVRVSDETR